MSWFEDDLANLGNSTTPRRTRWQVAELTRSNSFQQWQLKYCQCIPSSPRYTNDLDLLIEGAQHFSALADEALALYQDLSNDFRGEERLERASREAQAAWNQLQASEQDAQTAGGACKEFARARERLFSLIWEKTSAQRQVDGLAAERLRLALTYLSAKRAADRCLAATDAGGAVVLPSDPKRGLGALVAQASEQFGAFAVHSVVAWPADNTLKDAVWWISVWEPGVIHYFELERGVLGAAQDRQPSSRVSESAAAEAMAT